MGLAGKILPVFCIIENIYTTFNLILSILMWSKHKGFTFCFAFSVYAHPLKDRPDLIPIERKKRMEDKLNTSLFSVLSVRLREGFTLRNIILLRGKLKSYSEKALYSLLLQ